MDVEAPESTLHSAEWKAHLPEVAGAIVGLAAYNGIYLDLRLHPVGYRFFVERRVSTSFEDLRAVHPTLHQSLTKLRTTTEDIRTLGLSWAVRLPGSDADFDLEKGAAVPAWLSEAAPARDVEPAEVGRFVEAYAEAALVGAMIQQMDSFVTHALSCMAVGSAFALCTANDIELLLCGSPDIGDFKELEKNCTYANGYTAESPTVKLLWQVVRGMSEMSARKFLLFCTGCDRVPIIGLKALNFVVSWSSASVDHLPTANICFNQLNLPEYTSRDMVHDRLYAALEHHTGFGFA